MRGFTILEIVVVIGIFAVVMALGAGSLSFSKNNSVLVKAADESAALLSLARARTLSSENASRYGVHFASDRAVLFAGDSFGGGAGNESVFYGPSVQLAGVSLNGGGDDVVFKRLSGETDQYGTVAFRLKKNPETVRMITVEKTGVASVE